MKKSTKVQIMAYASFLVGVTGAYAVWLTWKKLTELIGDGWLIFGIVWGIVIVGILTGVISITKLTKKFKL